MGDDPIDPVDLLHDLVEPLHLTVPTQGIANPAHDLINRLFARKLTGGIPWWLVAYFAYEMTRKDRR